MIYRINTENWSGLRTTGPICGPINRESFQGTYAKCGPLVLYFSYYIKKKRKKEREYKYIYTTEPPDQRTTRTNVATGTKNKRGENEQR